jgi:hypothetical protein
MNDPSATNRRDIGVEGPLFPDRLTIAIPFHRVDAFFVSAISSVSVDCKSQDEILLINDSTMTSEDVAAWLKSRDLSIASNVRFIDNRVGGIVAARNIALENSRNEILSFLDSDDTWVAGRRDRHLTLLRTIPRISGVSSNVRYVCPHGRELAQSQIVHPLLLRMLGPISRFFPRIRTSATTIKVSDALRVGGFKSSESDCEDFGLWLRLQARGEPILVDRGVAANYTIHPDQVSHALAAKALQAHKTLTVAALREVQMSDLGQKVKARRILASIESGGILSWVLGYSRFRLLGDIGSGSPRVLLLALFLHLSARSYGRSTCSECEQEGE